MAAARCGIVAPKVTLISARAGTTVLLVVGTALPGRTAETPRLRVTEAEVRVICLLTVGGSFEARTAAVIGALVLAARDAR
jgi:hypothetical protein